MELARVSLNARRASIPGSIVARVWRPQYVRDALAMTWTIAEVRADGGTNAT
jgi:hypothetical protein